MLAGLVPGHEKPGEQVDDDAELEVERPPRFVSRGGEKLQNALDALGVDVAGRGCADVGASTGGFTDCLLQAGAARVVAIDVGYGQLHPRLRVGPARHRARADERARADASCRSRRSSSSATSRSSRVDEGAAAGARARSAGLGGARARQAAVRGGAQRGREGRRARPGSATEDVLRTVIEAARAWGGVTVGVVDSGLPGPKGNREFFVHLVQRPGEPNPDDSTAGSPKPSA